MSGVRELLRLWFTFEQRVTRRDYFLSGVTLMALKYLGDAVLVWVTMQRIWAPGDYLRSLLAVRETELGHAPASMLVLLAAWSLPFVWIGVSMTLRRALGAGRSAWWSLLFFVPYANYALMLAMSLLPSAPSPQPVHRPGAPERRLPSALLSIAAGAALGLAMLALSIYALQSYGAALFFGTPFAIGC